MIAYRQNIEYIVRDIGSQTMLAIILKQRISQQAISAIIAGKRQLFIWEERAIEEALGIPEGWLRIPGLIPLLWPFISHIVYSRSLDLPYPHNRHVREMEERLQQLQELLKLS